MKKKDRKVLIIAIALIAVAAFMLVLLLCCSGEQEQPEDELPAVERDIVQMIEIETPYCTLEYPEMWSEYLKHYSVEEAGVYAEVFSCVMNGQELELFRVVFNDSEARSVLGALKVDGQEIPVYMELQDLALDESWAGSEDVIYAMADGVNDVIASVKNEDSFTID